MGLDMYLSADKYLGDWDHSEPTERDWYRKIACIVDLPGFRNDDSPSLTVSITVLYWREAYAIHDWFIQDGADECGESYISRESLKTLRDLCHEVLANKDPLLLHPYDGFCSSGTDIDEYYWEDIRQTGDALSKLLADERFASWDFYYHSSW
jgi:hypothetical protein